MNAHAPSAFGPALRGVADGLAVPVQGRVRFLRELAGDLEALTEQLVGEGVPIDEARRRAEEALVPDPATLASLGELHQPLYVRLTRHVDPARLRRLERWALASATLFVVAVGSFALIRADLPGGPSPFQWPVLALGAAVFALAGAKAFQLIVKQEDRSPRHGLDALLVLVTLPGAASLLGATVDLYRMAAVLEREPGRTAEVATAWLFTDATLLATGLLTTLAGGLAWLLLSQWAAHLENQQREVLGLTGAPAQTTGETP